jgi:hypothetical protein
MIICSERGEAALAGGIDCLGKSMKGQPLAGEVDKRQMNTGVHAGHLATRERLELKQQ